MAASPPLTRTPLLLLPLLLLLPRPGDSQYGVLSGLCPECKEDRIVKKEKYFPSLEFAANRAKGYKKCPNIKSIQFQMQGGIICASDRLSWVAPLMECIDDKKCLNSSSSGSQQEFSKGSNVIPSTTTTILPTPPPVTTKSTSPDRVPPKATEPTTQDPAMTSQRLETKESPGITPPNTNVGNNKLMQGADPSEAGPVEDPDGKMKHMKIAIISLILIVLALVAVSTGLYCWRKRTNSQALFEGSHIYLAAPTEDSIEEVKIQ